MKEKLLTRISQLLSAIAPALVTKTACISLWGEPEMPQSLKEL